MEQVKEETATGLASSVETGWRGQVVPERWALLSYSSTGNMIAVSTGWGEHVVFTIEVVDTLKNHPIDALKVS